MKRWKNDFLFMQNTCDVLRKRKIQGCEDQEEIMEQDPWLYPQEIQDWIVQLKILKGVPLSALIGDEKQLPPESIRFFYLDGNWTDQMINGALSIGAGDEKAVHINDSFLSDFHVIGRKNIHCSRKNCIHINQLQFYKPNFDLAEEYDNVITGFIMRSRLVRLWKGLESTALDGYGRKLDILRMEELSGEIMLCLYQGEIAALQLKEPKEGLRFGTQDNDRKICVRDVKGGKEGVPLANRKVQIRVNERGRANILSLADDLKKELGGAKLTSAELAMELIVAPGLAEFQRQ